MYAGLHWPGWLYVLGIPPRADMPLWPPEYVPRTSARAQTYVRGPDGLPACDGAESTRNDPRPEETEMTKGQKTHFYMYIYRTCVLLHFHATRNVAAKKLGKWKRNFASVEPLSRGGGDDSVSDIQLRAPPCLPCLLLHFVQEGSAAAGRRQPAPSRMPVMIEGVGNPKPWVWLPRVGIRKSSMVASGWAEKRKKKTLHLSLWADMY